MPNTALEFANFITIFPLMTTIPLGLVSSAFELSSTSPFMITFPFKEVIFATLDLFK